MKRSFGRLPAATVAILVLVSFAMAPFADAAGGRGGGGGTRAAAGGGGGGAHAGGGGARQNVQADNSRADSRTSNVRNTSVNNVNVSRDVNVNVDRGWDDDHHHHPVAAAAVVGAAIAVGTAVATVPVGCVPVNYGGMIYQQCGGTWYQPQGSQYVVVNPPY